MCKDVIAVKIDSISHYLERIVLHTPKSAEDLTGNYGAQDIISVNLERIIQACVDMGAIIISENNWTPAQTMKQTFAMLHAQKVIAGDSVEQMKKAIGFRNISVHEYQKINWDIVFAICTKHLDDFKCFARQVSEYVFKDE
ncbi:MAG: DUF86 domain-containing protein [Pseudomonadota bacterium]|nr:DUF86 domain-containing protein [Pseudomonadota bacterium]